MITAFFCNYFNFAAGSCTISRKNISVSNICKFITSVRLSFKVILLSFISRTCSFISSIYTFNVYSVRYWSSFIILNVAIWSLIFSTPFNETILLPLYILGSFLVNWLIIYTWVYFWVFYSVPLICVYFFAKPYCFDYYSFLM